MDDDERLGRLRAIAHPLRVRMLSALTGQPMSAAELARALGCTQANASYHLRLLARAGLVEVAEQVEIRGGVATRYRYLPDGTPTSGGASTDDHVLLAAVLGAELQRRTMSRDVGAPGPLTDAELWVRPGAWDDFCATVTAASIALHAAAEPAGTAGTVRTSTTISLFRMVTG